MNEKFTRLMPADKLQAGDFVGIYPHIRKITAAKFFGRTVAFWNKKLNDGMEFWRPDKEPEQEQEYEYN